MSQIQSVRFRKNKYTQSQARKWMKDNNITPLKRVDITKNWYRFRIREPYVFKKMWTRVVNKNIHFILGSR